MVDGCTPCAVGSGAIEAPGVRVAETASWAVEHCVGPYGVGAMVVRTKEHVEDFWRLGEEAAAELGPLLRDVALAIVEALGAERVYQAMWVDKPPHHVHIVLYPRYPRDSERALGLLEKRVAAGVPLIGEAAVAAGAVRNRLRAIRS